MEYKESLKKETEKWLERLKNRIESIRIIRDSPELRNCLENIEAYRRDSEYFIKKGDFLRGFEAVVYAWGILETCERLKLISLSST